MKPNPPPSTVSALTAGAPPSVDELRARLSAASFILEGATVTGSALEGTVHFEQRPHRGAFAETLSRHVVISSLASPDLGRLQPAFFGVRELEPPRGAVRVAMRCEDVPALDYHAQLKLAATAEPGLCAFFDESANAVRSAAWARETAAARTPPAPAALFTIQPGGSNVRTHGLTRFGLPEFQLDGVASEHVARACALLEAWCALFLDGVGVDAGAPLTLAPGLEATWHPLASAGTAMVAPVREGASLFAGPEPTVWFRSRAEGARAALLAHERLPLLERLVRQHDHAPGWRFWFKAAVTPEGTADTEHLWFELVELAAAHWRGRLSSKPVAGPLRQGELVMLGVDEVSDWRVESPLGSFGPDDILELERR